MIQKLLPAICPSCGKVLKVTRLKCGECQTTVEGDYDLPVLSRLEPEENQFILNLLKSEGSLKELAQRYGVSYPTVRNRLDALIEKVKNLEGLFSERKENT
jgi:hypothetical protein